jgi:hypothetical protein
MKNQFWEGIMGLHLAHKFKKAADAALNKVRKHRWHMMVEMSEGDDGNNYYICKKTGDRRADTDTLRNSGKEPNLEWLQAGSGQYYINSQEQGTRTNPDAVTEVHHILAAQKQAKIANQHLFMHSDDNRRRKHLSFD